MCAPHAQVAYLEETLLLLLLLRPFMIIISTATTTTAPHAQVAYLEEELRRTADALVCAEAACAEAGAARETLEAQVCAKCKASATSGTFYNLIPTTHYYYNYYYYCYYYY